ncbi:MAG TPA: CHAD domain-containing protein, partial [Polyangiaceae bacterium]
QLAVARDYDVFLASMHHLEDALPSAPLGRAELAQMLADRRQEGFAIASSAAASVRFQRLILSSACALIARADGEAGAGIPARDLARTVLEHRTQRVLHRLGRFARLSVRERHELRIQVKKLRYGTDFFATLFSKTNRARQRFSRELEALQDVLGRLNDIAVHRRIARELIAGGTSEGCGDRRIAFAMGALAGKEQAESGSLPAAVPKLRARLAKAPRFWR